MGVLVALSLTAACGGSDDASDVELPGTSWTLIDDSLGVPVPDGVTVTISFTTDGVMGNAGCNDYSGSYTSDDGAIAIGPLATTRKACVPDVALVENAVLEQLGAAASVAVDSDELSLLDADDVVVLTFRRAP